METSLSGGPTGVFSPIASSVPNSMKEATTAGIGPKMKKARKMAISPRSN